MPLDSQNLLKGRVLEQLIATVFRRAKYTVVPLGVEHQFPDIDELTVSEHLNLLPESLRLLPDLMVYRWEANNPKVFFIETKFRSCLSDLSVQDLKSKLSKQAKYWAETYCILAVSEQPKSYRGGDYQQNYIRVFQAIEVENFPSTPHDFWRATKRIDKVFPEFSSFLKENPLADEVNDEYARTLEPLLDDAVKILKALGEITPRRL